MQTLKTKSIDWEKIIILHQLAELPKFEKQITDKNTVNITVV